MRGLFGLACLTLVAALLVSGGPVPAPRLVTTAAPTATVATSPRSEEASAWPAVAQSPAVPGSPAVTGGPAVTESQAVTGRDIAGARIEIPRLGIALPLVWGDVVRDVPRAGYAGDTPEGVALLFPGSSPPGAGGNTYIYSHARTGMFLALWTVRPGDLVVIRWNDAELRYAVDRVIPRVDPADTTWLEPSGREQLTLQTSTGPRASDPRFVAVAGRLMGSR